MLKGTYTIIACEGKNCKLKNTCRKYHNWLNDDDSMDVEIAPAFVNNQCVNYDQIEFYGN